MPALWILLCAIFPVSFMDFKSDEIAASVNTSPCGGAAAHTIIEHQLALVGISLNEVLKQGNRLLRRVDSVALALKFKRLSWVICEASNIRTRYVLCL